MLRAKQEELSERLTQQLKTFHDEMKTMQSSMENKLDEHATLIEVNKAMIEETQTKVQEDLAYMEKVMQRAFKKQQDDIEI